jgi:hypothetical protein
MSIYADLLEFKRGILDRVRRDVASLRPLARKAAAADVQIIEDQMHGYQARLGLWYSRIWELHVTTAPLPPDKNGRPSPITMAVTLPTPTELARWELAATSWRLLRSAPCR